MWKGKRLAVALKVVLIIGVFVASFLLPNWAMPRIDPNNTLPDIQRSVYTSFLAALPSFTGLLLSFLIHNVERINLIYNWAILYITNRRVSWALSVEYKLDQEDGAVGDIFADILAKYDDADVLQNSPREKLINISQSIGGVISIKSVAGTESSVGTDHVIFESRNLILFKIFDLNIPFRESEQALDSIDWILSNIVERRIKSEDAKYTFKINFGDRNPYYGLYIRSEQIFSGEMMDFSCRFIDRHGQSEGFVDVSDKRMALVTDNSADFRLLSKRYVSLAAFDGLVA